MKMGKDFPGGVVCTSDAQELLSDEGEGEVGRAQAIGWLLGGKECGRVVRNETSKQVGILLSLVRELSLLSCECIGGCGDMEGNEYRTFESRVEG